MPPKTSRVLAWISLLAAGVLLLAVLGASVIVWRPGVVQPFIIKALTPSGGTSSIGKLEISLSPPRLVLLDFKLSHPSEPSISLKTLHLNIDMPGLWGDGPWLELVEAEGLSLELKVSAQEHDQDLDLSQLDLILAVKEAKIKDAHIAYLFKQSRLDLAVAYLTVTPGQNDQREFKLASQLSWTNRAGKRSAWTRIKGSGVLDRSPSLEAKLDLTDGGLDLTQLQGDFHGALSMLLTPKQVRITRMEISLAKGTGNMTPARLELSGRGGLDGRDLVLELHRLDLGKLVSLSGGFKGSLKQGLGGGINLHGRAEWDQAAIKQANLSADIGGTLDAPHIKNMTLNIEADRITWQGRIVPIGEIQITGDAALEPGQRLRLKNWSCKAEKLGDFQASLLLEDWRPKQAVLNANGLSVAGIWALVQNLKTKSTGAWSTQGNLDLAASLGKDQPGQWQADIFTKDLGFSSADGTVLVGQLAGQVNFSGNWAEQPRIDARVKLDAGQALWGTIFLDMAKTPLEFKTQARVMAIDDFRQIEFSGRLSGMGRCSGQGMLKVKKGVPHHQGSLVMRDLDMTKLFNTFVRDPFSISLPILASWQVGGRAQLDLNGVGQGAKTEISGRLQISQASLKTGQGSSLGRLELDLPISYRLGGPAPKQPLRPKRLGWGSVKLKEVQLPGLTLADLEMPLALTPNRLWVLGSVEAPLAGGRAVVSDLAVDQPLSSKFMASFMAQLEDLNLAELAGPSLPLEGSLGGRLSEVTLTKNQLRTNGQLEGTFFGGSLLVKRLSAELPFSPGRELSASIEARRVHMEPLSQALQVGRITGRLDAEMQDLRLAYGQPVAFELRVESMKAHGVDQDVSLKAVNSISLLGTGAGLSGMGLNLFASFFKEFPYEKIAFSCKLKNDEFRVRGLIHQDGVEYLVKRPMLMGINVINRNPDNRISFSDMLERLQRVQQDNAPRVGAAETKEER